jgi:hypothetical protein
VNIGGAPRRSAVSVWANHLCASTKHLQALDVRLPLLRSLSERVPGERRRYRPKPRLGRTSTPKKVTANAVTNVQSLGPPLELSLTAAGGSLRDATNELMSLGIEDGFGALARKRKACELVDPAADLTFGLDGMSISIAVSRSGVFMNVEE